MKRLRARGFTLIELMVVVAIVAIFASIAYPSYVAYVQRGKIAEATGTLADARVRLEQFYQDNRNYGATGTSGWACAVAAPAGVRYFTYSCVRGASGDAQSFLLTATGVAAQGMSGFTYTIDNQNAKQTTAFPGVTGTSNCWIQKAGDSC